MPPYSSQSTPPKRHTPFDTGDLIPRTGASTNPKPTYTSLLSCTSWSLTPCCTHSSSALQKLGIPNHVVFVTNSEVLNHLSTFSRQDKCIYQTIWLHSINCNFIPQKDSMIPYMAQTRHLLNSQVLAIFTPSATTSATH